MKGKDWKNIVKKLIFPPVWVLFLLVVMSAVLLTVVFVKGWEESPLAYASYVLAFYSLSVICIACYETFPEYYRKLKQKVYSNKYGHKYLSDAAFKTHVSLYCSLGINLLYVIVNIVSGIIYSTAWFGILAGYYAILAVMRFILLRFFNKNTIGSARLSELRRSRLCAIILVTVNFALSGGVLMILYQNRGFEYNGILIYVVASYTFYITVTAVIDTVKYRKYNSPVMSTVKVIKLAAALVSMLSLETAMLSQFGAESSAEFKRIMIAATGGGVSVIIISMSIYMIAKANREIKNMTHKV